eukprot:TRINITY_DN2406_c0_g1_i19.p1 TRINITY_DN2406_c0_g1~~TRINITY_DN2406_c0_g1_i19.p1  ORF type:complete len:262 (+),score=44.40 TRINITY_DN2406_c0_g1_i19:34-786(+)
MQHNLQHNLGAGPSCILLCNGKPRLDLSYDQAVVSTQSTGKGKTMISSLIILTCVLETCTGIQFLLPTTGSTCLQYEFDKDVLVYGNFTYINRPSSIETEVVVTVEQEEKHQVWRSRNPQLNTGSFGFVTIVDAKYNFCFIQKTRIRYGFRNPLCQLQVHSRPTVEAISNRTVDLQGNLNTLVDIKAQSTALSEEMVILAQKLDDNFALERATLIHVLPLGTTFFILMMAIVGSSYVLHMQDYLSSKNLI